MYSVSRDQPTYLTKVSRVLFFYSMVSKSWKGIPDQSVSLYFKGQ